MHDEIVVDLFAGGGGASDGIELALGRPVTIAINHSRTAIECHQRNHPHTHHEIADVWEVDPVEACAGRPVELLWASPSCTHYSRAKGGHNPKSAEIRSLPWVVIRWARTVKPRMIFMENVPEFLDWGPLDEHGHPIKSKRGRTFAIWLGKLKAQGYQVEWRTLVAADYGAPTTRKRVYLIARRDGQPIVWPEPTHAKHPSLWCSPWRTAAECIDWTLATRSIFDRKKPLAEKTLKRIAAGIVRYVLRAANPFVVSLTHHGGERTHSVDAPLPTITAANRGELALVAPMVSPVKTWGGGGNEARPANEPLRTVTASKRGEFALVAATLVQTGYGERSGQEPRALDIAQPLGTVVAGGQKHALCVALLTKHFGGVVGHDLTQPVGAITAKDHHALTAATLEGARDRREQVWAFLISYYGADGKPETQKQSLEQPLGTVTTRDRFALVTVNGVEHAITDIATRMLAPHELFAAQGFRTTYDLSGLTKTQQIQLCGNSVCPPVAAALVRANAAPASRVANDDASARRGAGAVLARAQRGEEVVTELNGHARKPRATSAPTRPTKTAMPTTYTIVRADCLTWMAEREPDSIHAIVTDPPYGLKEYTRTETTKLRNGRGGVWRIPPSFDGSTRSPLPRFTVLTPAERNDLRGFFAKFAAAAFRVLVPGGHVFIASSPLLSHLVYMPMIKAGFEKRGEIIRLVQTLRGGDRPKNAHEEFANVTVMPRSGWEPWGLFRKPCEGRVQDNLRKWGTGALQRLSKDQPFIDVIPSAPTRPTERALAPHPSLKPQALMRQLVRASLPLGRGIVLDPFMGGGATIAAAVALNYESIGIELDPTYYRIAEKGIPRLARFMPNAARVDVDGATLTLL